MLRKVVLILAGVVLLTGCGMSKEEKEFVDAVEEDIVAQYEAELSGRYNVDYAEESLGRLEKYRNYHFSNDEIDEVAKNYVSGVSVSKEYLGMDIDEITDNKEMFSRSMLVDNSERLKYEAIKVLVDDYGLNIDNEEAKRVLDGWMISMGENAASYEKLQSGISEARVKKSDRKVELEVENTSGRDIGHATFKISLLDEDGYVVYEDIDMVTSWHIGETYELSTYTTQDYDKVEITEMSVNWNM